ncbi:RluA family pseudouridine synthase [Schleiferilactobacillus harbinensis]|uniref:RluA family pseudouridine synthase n=1 Tax=Schleiferilactobacillus harbinensis TaxID=304207 RepID=UPI0007BA3B51|nr:RluA family pseudouridine synthase [Schleiferilactobacillus harbinensis]
MTAYQHRIVLPPDYPGRTVREQLQAWWIPKKWQHFLRIEDGVLVNGRYQSMNTRLHAGDLVSLAFTHVDHPAQDYNVTARSSLVICHEDSDVLVVDKPAGEKMHPNHAGESNTLMNAAASYLAASGGAAFMVHRLDQATSGAVLIAKNPAVVPPLNRQLAIKTLHREYLAVVPGTPVLPDHGHFTGPIAHAINDVRRRTVDNKNGQAADTEFRVLDRSSETQLLLLTLHSGRTHQIRVHLAHAGLPIIADPLYGPAADQIPEDKMLLHAWRLTWATPLGFGTQTATAPIPARFRPYLRAWPAYR